MHKCRQALFTGLTHRQATAIFLTIQHANPTWRKSFSPRLEKAHKDGIISNDQIALLRDRIAMDNEEPQKYGTQIREGQLYMVDNIDSVHARREHLGLIPLEEYLGLFE